MTPDRRRLGLSRVARGRRAATPEPRADEPAKPRVQKTLLGTVTSAVDDVWGIGREMLRWPPRVWMGTAEVTGRWVLRAWLTVGLPAIRLLIRALKAALDFGERAVTPARGLAVVAVAATVALGASQFADYRGVEVGAPDYTGVEQVAAAPEVDKQTPRSAHGITVFALAVVSLFITVFAVGRNWRLARLLLFLGIAVVAISLLVDAPQGVKEGSAAITYEGAKATLLGGFWVQLFSAAALIVVGPFLAVNLRAERDARSEPSQGSAERHPVVRRLPRPRIRGAAT